MAWDTSMLTPEVHQRLAAGETIEQIAASFKVHPAVVRQYLEKVRPK